MYYKCADKSCGFATYEKEIVTLHQNQFPNHEITILTDTNRPTFNNNFNTTTQREKMAETQPLRNQAGAAYLKHDGKGLIIVLSAPGKTFVEQDRTNRAFTVPKEALLLMLQKGFGKIDLAELPPRK